VGFLNFPKGDQMIQRYNIYKSKHFLLDGNLKIPKDSPPSLSEFFHENTKIFPYELRPWLYKRPPAELEYVKQKDFNKRSARSYKLYNTMPQIPLPKEIANDKEPLLWETLRQRRSARRYANEPISLSQLSKILYFSYGEVAELNCGTHTVGLRTSPSAGALYPLDIYPLVLGVNSLESGLYHYNIPDHALELLKVIKVDELNDFLLTYIQPGDNDWLRNAAILFFITATFRRNKMKYSERGYRAILIDIGHLAQNILLSATGLNLSSCPILGFCDDPTNDLLGVDGVEESIMYVISVAHPSKEEN
jgi:SagB-type dehydrogenase family enzyme